MRTLKFLSLFAAAGVIGFALHSGAQTPAPSPLPEAIPSISLELKPNQKLLWSQPLSPTSMAVMWRQRREYEAPKNGKAPPSEKEADELQRKSPSLVIDEIRPDWWEDYNLELRSVGVPPKLLWQRQMGAYKSSWKEDELVFQVTGAWWDSQSLIFTYRQFHAGTIVWDLVQGCPLKGGPIEGLDWKNVKGRLVYGSTLMVGAGWPLWPQGLQSSAFKPESKGYIETLPEATLGKAVPPAEGEWLLNVSDEKGNKSQWQYKNGKWSQTLPFTRAPQPPPLTAAQKAALAKLEKRKENMGLYESLRKVGASKEQATQGVREQYGDKTWKPSPAAWDTPDFKFDLEHYYPTPTPKPDPPPAKEE